MSFTTAVTGTVSGHSATGTGNINETVNLGVGSTLTYTVRATVAAGTTGQITNLASVTPPTGVEEINAIDNTDNDTNVVLPTVDLSVAQTDGQTNVAPGQEIEYQIVVANNGPNPVVNAEVLDTFPASLTNVTFTSTTTTGTVSGNTPSGSGNINDLVTMGPNSSVTYTVTRNRCARRGRSN